MMNLVETNNIVVMNEVAGLTLEELLLHGQIRRLADEMLEKYMTISDEELYNHFSDDIVDFQRYGLKVLSDIARDARETLRVNKVRDLEGYRFFIEVRFEEFYKATKRYLINNL